MCGCLRGPVGYSVGDDQLWGVVRRRKGINHTWAALQSIHAACPDGVPIYAILDNLSAHLNWRIRRWADGDKVALCFTPTYASWANPIKAHFRPPASVHSRQLEPPQPHSPDPGSARLPALARQDRAAPTFAAPTDGERAGIRSEKHIRWGGTPLRLSASTRQTSGHCARSLSQ
ncbi:transposase [Streptomyces sp. HUAS TT11]|uniref:transposase n=1 Tax=Streptomyces sp. HUAS TT11 TaxID=3447508 RepID=UPI003F65D29B